MLQAVANECADDPAVLLHDGVRPLINHQLITENIEAVRTHGSAITCTKFNETVTVVHDDAITEAIPRDHIYAAQAWQSFRLAKYWRCTTAPSPTASTTRSTRAR